MNTKLLLYIITPVILASLVNLITYLTGWRMRENANTRNKLLPPGYVVGIIWTVLFAILGYILYLLRNNAAATLVTVIFLIYGLVYNYLPVSLFHLWNLIALLLAFLIVFTILLTEKYSQMIFLVLLTPLIIWATYVNVIFSLRKV